MKYIVYILFGFIFVVEYAAMKMGLASRLITIVPEFLSMIVAGWVLLNFAFNKGIKIRPRYFLLFFAVVVHVAIGLVGNMVQPLAVFAGLRTYFKFLPFYFLPMVSTPTEKQMQRQLQFLLGLTILQFPLALYQRFFEFHGIASGDKIAGTLVAAPILTLFLVGAAAVLIAFYLKKHISFSLFVVLMLIVFVPTAINETKSTVILLPLALLIPTLLEVRGGARIKIIATVIPTGILMVVGFHLIYKNVYAGRSDVVTFFTSDKVQEYLYKGARAERVSGEFETEVGRIDAIVLAFKENSRDLFRLFWGVGIGNAGASFSEKFKGTYAAEYARLGGKQNGLAHFIWEIGLLGVVHILWLLLLIFSDVMGLRKQPGVVGALALGWIGVVAVSILALPYQNVITKNGLIYPFFYISGYLAARRYMLEKESA